MTFKRLISILVVPAVLLTMGAGCFGGGSAPTASAEKVTLKYWRVFDEKDSFEEIIKAYEALHPNVTIEYRKLRTEDYEKELIRALAEGEGPDIFSLHNTKMGEYQNLLQPMPSEVNVTYQVAKGTLRKEVVLEARREPTLSQKAFKQQFVDVVAMDAIRDYQPDPEEDATERIFGVPLAVDTLSLFYNEELLNAAGIAEPPKTWEDFMADSIKLTKYDSNGGIIQSGAALGTTKNVERPADILSALMLQNGTVMTDERGRVAFHTIPSGTPEGVFPGLDAVRFYTDFANPTREAYSWNETFPNNLEAFANGQAAFFLGYSYHIPTLESMAPKLEYSVAKLPQISGSREVNYGNYWLETVSKTTKSSDYAWDFLLYAADPDHVGTYLAEAKKPTALRSLISSQLEDETLGVFASQLLTAKSWYKGKDADAMEKAFKDLSNGVLLETGKPEDVLSQAARVVSQTY
jgi:multiple sugar transport system substrate-binding protein